MQNEVEITEILEWNKQDLCALSALLVVVVEGGASLGFLPPLAEDESLDYWKSVVAPDVKLWVARYQEEIVGTIQLHLSSRQNGTHRAEIAKLMVHPKWRNMGIARRLMANCEETAIQERRSLVVLDTRAGDPSNDLYRSMGYIEAGRIPQYAKSANGQLDATVLYFKLLSF